MGYMNFLELKGEHGILSPSRSGWENKSIDEMIDSHARSYATDIGTAVHDICAYHILKHEKLTNADKKELRMQLMKYYNIPKFAIDRGVDFDMVFDTAKLYVNDAIGYRMVPEQMLCYFVDPKYKKIALGTADAISDFDSIFKTKLLRIHDLKTGVTPAHMSQLCKYAALFCLQYNVKPSEIDMEFRIYQLEEVSRYIPSLEDIVPLMDDIRVKTEAFTKLFIEES